jgi:hypothetical protein
MLDNSESILGPLKKNAFLSVPPLLAGLPTDTKRTTVGDRRVLNSKCPKRVGGFGYSTDFLMRGWYEVI